MSLDTLRTRMKFLAGNAQDNNVESKLRSFHSALGNSYQREWITLDKGVEDKERKYLCLINPSRLTEEFDKKVISIDFDSQIKEGDVFYWDRTDRYWMVNLQQHTEEAYFRGIITRCDYQITIDGETYWVYLRGPVETSIDWKQKHNLTWNELNYTLLMSVPKNEHTMNYFSRFKKIKFDNHNWTVAAVDKYSEGNLIQVYLDEDYDNEMEDSMILPEIIVPDATLPHIDGPQFVKVYDTALVYKIKNASGGKFVVNSSKVKVNFSDENSCEIDILTGKSNNFDILYQRDGEDDVKLNVTIESF